MKRTLRILFAVWLVCLGPPLAAQDIYRTTFDNLTPGPLHGYPGLSTQDHWFGELVEGNAIAEIQGSFSASGQAMHLLAPATNPSSLQTIARQFLPRVVTMGRPSTTLSFDFLAHTSDLETVNPYAGTVALFGNYLPHSIVDLIGGNGAPRGSTGVNLLLTYFNGTDNDGSILPDGGAELAFDAWHHVELVVNDKTGQLVSVNVDGQTSSLAGALAPRVPYQGKWQRASYVDMLQAQVVAQNGAIDDHSSDDHLYIDNFSVVTTGDPMETKLAAPAVTAAFGALAKLKATLRAGNVALDGQEVAFKVDGAPVGVAVTSSSGLAALQTRITETVGSHTITVEYAGSPFYKPASASGTLTVLKAPTRLTADVVKRLAGTLGPYGARLNSATDGSPLAGRTITFLDGSTVLGSAITDTTGRAAITLQAPASGVTQLITASFAGDATYLGKTSTGKLIGR